MFFKCCNEANVENLYSTIIPAVAGIIGVMLGFFANMFGKYLDNKENRRRKRIESFESYYEPIAKQFRYFLYHVEQYKKKASNIQVSSELSYSHLVDNNRSELNPEIDAIKSDVINIYKYMVELSYIYSGNFKVKFYCDKTFELMNELNDVIQFKRRSDKRITFDIIEQLLAQIEKMVNPTCFIYRYYSQIWKYLKNKKYLNNKHLTLF
jgi:hypothetical protein